MHSSQLYPDYYPFSLCRRTWTKKALRGPNDKNAEQTNKQQQQQKSTHSSLSVDLRSSLLKVDVWKSPKHDRERCHLVCGSLRLWRHKQGRQAEEQKANLFCFSSVTSGGKGGGGRRRKRYFCCVNSHGATTRSL